MSETVEKLARVRKYLKTHGLEGVVLLSRANFAWLSGGGDSHIVSQSERGFGALVVTAKQALLVANKIEIERIANEEPVSSFTAKSFPWIQSMADALPKILGANVKKFASDDAEGTGLQKLPGDFIYECRAELLEPEIRRYKALGRDCSLVMETVCRQTQVGDSEWQVEADMARHLLARGIQPYVLLVAFDQRIARYRHPMPTANHLKRHGMLVICGARGGLIACLTRLIHFGPIPEDLLKRHEAVCRVDGAYWHATKVGTSYGKVLQAGIDQYKKEGFAKEWELHHQGGPTGYAGRDIVATPDEKRAVLDKQAVAWNPSITGTKGEDTFIVDGANRIAVTACSPDWPVTKVTVGGETFSRPSILVR
jgi:Xaa-Pro aminopeptidase